MLCGASAAALWAQPAIGQNGVVNAASRIPGALAGGALARGALVEIRGVRFGSDPEGARVQVAAAGASIEIPALRIQGRHLSFVLPESVPVGEAAVRVRVRGEWSAPAPVRIAAANPGIFSRNGLGWGPGQIENLAAGGARQANGLARPARRGQNLAVRVTGLGAGRTVAYRLGGARGISGPARAVAPGEMELLLRVPERAAQGCFVPLWLEAGPRRASNVVTVAVQDRDPCSAVLPLLEGERVGVAVAARTNGVTARDEAVVAFAAKGAAPVFAPVLMLPPPGACTSYTGSFQSGTIVPQSISSSLIADLGGDGLDAGPELEIRRGGDRRVLPRVPGAPGLYRRRLGARGPEASPRDAPLFLEPGIFEIVAPGGAGLGPLRLALEPAPALRWTNPEAARDVPRDRDLRLSWTPGTGLVVALAMNVEQESTASAMTFCVAGAAQGALAVPAELLANVPPAGSVPGPPYNQVFLATLRTNARTGVPGLDRALAVSLDAAAQSARFR
jgi:uncharacterized protein (TIGR03437 family)